MRSASTFRGGALLAVLGILPVPGVAGAGGIVVEGRVVDAGGGGIAGARAVLRTIPSRYQEALGELQGKAGRAEVATVATRVDGGFTLTAPAPGVWEVEVAAPGFVPLRSPALPLVEDVTLPVGTMAADAGCRVRVLAPDGRPAAGARVRAEAVGSDAATDGWQPAERSAFTGPDGRVRLPRSAAEPLLLRAYLPGLPPEVSRDARSGETTLRLSPGERRRLEVRGPAGRPLAGAIVREPDGGFALGLTDPQGRLAVDLPAGREASLLVETAGGRRVPCRWRAAADPSRVHVLRLPPPLPLFVQAVEARSGRPLAGAWIWPASDPGRASPTGEDGALRWRTPADDETVHAASPGHLESTVSRAGRRAVTISLAPSAVLSGSVVDPEGRPLAGVDVEISSAYGERATARHRRTSGAGAFAFAGLGGPADYFVRAVHSGFATAALTVEMPESGPSPPLRLTLRRGRTATGRIEDAAGRPVVGARVEMSLEASAGELQAEDDSRHVSRSDSEGRFTIASLSPGWLSLQLAAPGLAPLRREVRLAPEADVVDLGLLRLAAVPPVAGQVTDPAGRPLGGAEVWLSEVSLHGPSPVGEGPAARSGPDGGFAITDLPADPELQLDVCRPGFRPLAVRLAQPAARPVEAILQPEGALARLEGRVTDATRGPVAGARIELAARIAVEGEDLASPCLRSVWGESGGDGAFSFPVLPPGRWMLRVQARGYQETVLDELSLDAGEHRGGLEIALQPAAVVAGRVFLADGTPAEGATLLIDGPASAVGTSERDGSYRLEGVVPGEVTLAAWGLHGSAARRQLLAAPGENRLDLTLDAGGDLREIRGRVVGPDGAPFPGTRVQLFFGRDTVFPSYTEADGSFRFVAPGPDGVIVASREGYLCAPFQWDGGDVDGVELRLARAGTITGTLRGLSPEELRGAVVGASFAGEAFLVGHRGFVDATGSYQIPDVAPGDWRVGAAARGGSWRGEGEVVVQPGDAETVLDLPLTPVREPR